MSKAMFDAGPLTYFHFLRPWWLLVLLPVILMVLFKRHNNDPLRRWRELIAPHLLQAMVIKTERRRWFSPRRVLLPAAVVLSLAAAGPSWDRVASPFAQDRASLLVVLSLSATMNASDLQPSRLDRAKQKITDLLALRSGAPTALIVFAGSAHTLLPPTTDADIFTNYLDALNTSMMPVEGSLPATTLPLIERLAGIEAEEVGEFTSVLLITDSLASEQQQKLALFFQQHRLPLWVWGAGPEAIEPRQEMTDTDYLPFIASPLQELARLTGGRYQSMRVDQQDVLRINDQLMQHFMLMDDERRPWNDRGYYLLFVFVPIFLLWFRRGWTLSWVVLVFMMSVLESNELYALDMAEPVSQREGHPDVQKPAEKLHKNNEGGSVFVWQDLWLTRDQQGQRYFSQGEYQQAAEIFDDVFWQATSYYYQEDFLRAAELFGQIDTVESRFYQANAWAHGQHYVKARDAYQRLLLINPLHEGAMNNLNIMKQIIRQINAMSEHQVAEPGDLSMELADQPRRADGAESRQFTEEVTQSYSAQQILANPEIEALWLRQVESNPSRFLSVKFLQQQQRLEQRLSGNGSFDTHQPNAQSLNEEILNKKLLNQEGASP